MELIQGHPQKSSYADPSEWPDISCQNHWNELNKLISHSHFDVKAPIYSHISDLLKLQFAIKLFQFDGEAFFVLDSQELVTKIEWDETGSETSPRLIGDPSSHALKQWTGHLTIDPHRNVGGHGFPLRGWYSPQIQVDLKFNSGATITQLFRLPFYSMLDPTAPDGSLSGAPLLIASGYPHSSATDEWGTNYVEVDNYLPLLPINADWPLIVGTASYGGRNIGEGFFEHRYDLDLHNDNHGILLSLQYENSFTSANRAPLLSPGIMGPGNHKTALMWSKPTLDEVEMVTALLVINTPVGDSVSPTSTIVPNVVGQSINSAVSILASSKLSIGSITSVVDNNPINQVISQSPVDGTTVLQGSVVNLVKSSGPASTGTPEIFTPIFKKLVVAGQPTKYYICESEDSCKEI